MALASRLGRQIAEVTAALHRIDVQFALIGGLALAFHNVVRATQDVDLLVDLDSAEKIDAELIRLGYRAKHRSTDAANYVRNDERIDFLFASRPIARKLLASARQLQTSLGELRVIRTEGLNSCIKSNDQPLAGSGGVLAQPSHYDDPYQALDDLMAVIEVLCPVWPERKTFASTDRFLL